MLITIIKKEVYSLNIVKTIWSLDYSLNIFLTKYTTILKLKMISYVDNLITKVLSKKK